MLKPFHRTIALLLTSLLALTALAGCKSDSGGDVGGQTPADVAHGDSPPDFSEYVYVPQTVPLPRDIGGIYNVVLVNDKVYFSGTISEPIIGSNDDNAAEHVMYQRPALYSMSIDGTELAALPNYAPPVTVAENSSGFIYIAGMAADNDGGIWVIERWEISEYNLPENFNAKRDALHEQVITSFDSGTVVRKLDAGGGELHRINVGGLQSELGYLNFIAFSAQTDETGDGSIYISFAVVDNPGHIVYVLNFDGEVESRLDIDYKIDRFIPLPDGIVAIVPDPFSIRYASDSNGALQTIDRSTRTLGETFEIPGFSEPDGGSGQNTPRRELHYYPAQSDEFDILISDGTSLYGYALGEKAAEPLLSWADSNVVVNNTADVYLTPDGQIVCTQFSYSENMQANLIVLTKTPRTELPEKTVITLAGVSISEYVTNAALEFNRQSADYVIEIKDYMEYFDGSNGYPPALERMLLELNAGTVPDILDVRLLADAQYADKGLFADLYPYIDADPQLDRSDFVPGVLQSAEVDAALYKVFPSFSLETVIGAPAVFGAIPPVDGVVKGLNVEECLAVLDANPGADLPMGFMIIKSEFLRNVITYNIDEYIDWETGTAHFDSPAFIRLLELCDRFPAQRVAESEYDERYRQIGDDVGSGRQIMSRKTFSGFAQMRMDNTGVFGGSPFDGGDFICVGYPASNRKGHSIDAYFISLAITENSPHKDAAWSFIRTFLTRDWQIDKMRMEFPTNQAAFDYIKDSELNFMRGEGVGAMFIEYPDGTRAEIKSITQRDVDLILALIDEAADSSRRSIDEPLLNIITEGAAGFFAGEKSAEQAAADIQRRAAIYVSERS